MKLLKTPKLPKLRTEKYKCPNCGSRILSEDKELLIKNKIGTDGRIYPFNMNEQMCPFCGRIIKTKKRQYLRVAKYLLISYNNDRLYGYIWKLNDPNAPETQWECTSFGNTEKENLNDQK